MAANRNGAGRLPRLYSVRVASEETTIPASTIYDCITRGEIPVTRIGRAVRIDERDFLAWLQRCREAAS